MSQTVLDYIVFALQIAYSAAAFGIAQRRSRALWPLSGVASILMFALSFVLLVRAVNLRDGLAANVVFLITTSILPILVATIAVAALKTSSLAPGRQLALAVFATGIAGVISPPLGMVLMFWVAGATP